MFQYLESQMKHLDSRKRALQFPFPFQSFLFTLIFIENSRQSVCRPCISRIKHVFLLDQYFAKRFALDLITYSV